jgi:FkbM family methyltransferase
VANRLRTLQRRAQRRLLLRSLDVTPRHDLAQLGTAYGGWVIPAELLGPESVCYLAGTGEDITFDLALIDRFGCEVFAFDPVPRAAAHVERAAAGQPRHHFRPWGLWSQDTTLRFYAPDDPSYVSHSAINLKGSDDYFEATVRSVPSIMAELRHDRIDLLKVSAEGSEYEIVDHVLDVEARPRVLCVEFAQPAPMDRVRTTCDRVSRAGYDLVAPWRWKFTWVRRDAEH